MKVVAVIQARMSSSRLPGKVLKKLAGATVLSHVIARVKASGTAAEIVVATTEKPADDMVAAEAARCGAKVFRGSEEDVLSRYYLAAKEHSAEAVLRVTADDPLMDPGVLGAMVKLFREEASRGASPDYLSNNLGKRTFPLGLDVEVVRFGALETAFREAAEPYEREHVTPFLYRHPEKFKLKNFANTKDLSAYRWTLDTPEDWEKLSGIYDTLYKDGKIFDTQEVLRYLKEFVLGTAQLGMPYGLDAQRAPSSEEVQAILQEAAAAGVQRVDTARAYGEAEKRIGQALGGRENVAVVTKLDPLSSLSKDAPEENVRLAVDASVQSSCLNLKTQALPVLLLHRWEHRKNFSGAVWRRLLELKAAGRVHKLGVSVYEPKEALEALSDREVEHLQLPFNILDRRWHAVGEAALKRPEVTVDARSVFLQGLLTLEDAPLQKFEGAGIHGFIEKMNALVREFKRESRADLCLAYVRAQSWIQGVVLGSQTLGQLKENLRLFGKSPLRAEQARRIEAELIGAGEELLNPSRWRLS